MTDTTTQLESISEKLGITEPWVETGGAHWLAPGTKSVREITKVMNEVHARFITITAFQLPAGEGFRLDYHWDLDGQLLGVSFQLAANSSTSARPRTGLSARSTRALEPSLWAANTNRWNCVRVTRPA